MNTIPRLKSLALMPEEWRFACCASCGKRWAMRNCTKIEAVWCPWCGHWHNLMRDVRGKRAFLGGHAAPWKLPEQDPQPE